MPVFDFEDTLGNDPLVDLDLHNNRSVMALFQDGALVYELLADGFQYTTSGWKYRHQGLCIGDTAADSDDIKFPLLRLPFDVTLASVFIATDTTVAASDTNYESISLYNSRSTTPIATLTTAATGFTARVPREFTSLSATLSALKAGETLYLGLTKTGSGMALSGVQVQFAFTIDRSIAACTDYTDNLFRLIGGGGGTDGVLELDHTKRQFLRIKNRGVEKFRINLAGKMFGGAPDQYHVAVLNVGDIIDDDGSAKKSPLLKPDAEIEVTHIFFGQTEDVDADDDDNYTEVKIIDGSGNLLCSGYIGGPNGAGQDMEAGMLYNMGEINPDNARVTSSEQLQVEYDCVGTAATVAGLTVVVVYKKVA